MAKSKSKSTRRPTPKPKAGTRPTGQSDVLERIATALERLAPERATLPDLGTADAFVWYPDGRLAPVARVKAPGAQSERHPKLGAGRKVELPRHDTENLKGLLV